MKHLFVFTARNFFSGLLLAQNLVTYIPRSSLPMACSRSDRNVDKLEEDAEAIFLKKKANVNLLVGESQEREYE